MENTLKVLGVDPGYTTGWSLNEDNTELESGQVTFDEIVEWLNTHYWVGINYLVIEDFSLFKGKALAQIGSKFETCQVIGMFKLWADIHRIPVIMQAPTIKSFATKYSGRKVPSNHSLSHSTDAYLHAVFFLQQHGHFKTIADWEAGL